MEDPAYLAEYPLELLRNCIRYFLCDDEYSPRKESFQWLYSLDWTLMLAQQDLHGLPLLNDTRRFVQHSPGNDTRASKTPQRVDADG